MPNTDKPLVVSDYRLVHTRTGIEVSIRNLRLQVGSRDAFLLTVAEETRKATMYVTEQDIRQMLAYMVAVRTAGLVVPAHD